MNQVIERDDIRLFPIEGTNLYKILFDPQHRQAFHAQLKRYNPLMVSLYKIGLLPLFGMSRNVMLLTTRGRKSRKLRSTPIGYFRIGGVIHLFSAWGKGTAWYKNLLAYPKDVSIQIGLRKCPVTAQCMENPAEILSTIKKFVSESPAQAQLLFGWDSARDRMECADFSVVIKRVLIVRFQEDRKP